MIDCVPTPEAWLGLADLRGDIERTLARSCPDRNELEDLVQETLLRAARFRGGLRNPGALRPWVLRIAWNVMREYRRQTGKRRLVDVSEEFFRELEGREPSPASASRPERMSVGERVFESDDLLLLLADACRLLGPGERLLLGSYYGDGADCREVGRRLGIGRHSVKMRLFRLRRRLRRALVVRTAALCSPHFSDRENVA